MSTIGRLLLCAVCRGVGSATPIRNFARLSHVDPMRPHRSGRARNVEISHSSYRRLRGFSAAGGMQLQTESRDAGSHRLDGGNHRGEPITYAAGRAAHRNISRGTYRQRRLPVHWWRFFQCPSQHDCAGSQRDAGASGNGRIALGDRPGCTNRHGHTSGNAPARRTHGRAAVDTAWSTAATAATAAATGRSHAGRPRQCGLIVARRCLLPIGLSDQRRCQPEGVSRQRSGVAERSAGGVLPGRGRRDHGGVHARASLTCCCIAFSPPGP